MSPKEIWATTSLSSPTVNSGAWTNPANANADGGGWASMVSSTPSVAQTFGGYGFNLVSSTISQVRVRLDTQSVGGASVSQVRMPTTDEANTNGATPADPATRCNLVDETSPNDADYFVMVNNSGHVTCNLNPFTVPAGSTISNLTIYYRAGNTASNANNVRAAVKINGTYYDKTDPGNDTPNSPNWTTFAYAFATNPETGIAWSVDDINGIGAHALQAFGTATTDANPDLKVSMIYAQVNYTTANDEKIETEVSWDGGTTWSSTKHQQSLTGTETTYWVDVTGDTSWTPEKLSDANFKVRVDGLSVGDAGEVRLDWIPVEVSFAGLPTVTTESVSNIKDQTATANGTITATGGENVDKVGFVWDSASHGLPGNVAPGASGYWASAENSGSYSIGTFNANLGGLTGGTTYYGRAYAHNTNGYSYGGEVVFTTGVISIAITSNGLISYGMVAPGQSKDTTGTSLAMTQTIQNNGNIAENINIKTSNASGGIPWALGQSAGGNIFVHEFSSDGGVNWIKFGSEDSYQNLINNLAPSNRVNFDTKITVPTSTGDFLQKTIGITLQAVAY